MFENGFPREWSTLRKLAWLYRTVINAVIPVEKTVTGNPIHITDALAKPVQALSVALEPVQDLHGYDNPWPAGGGKNKFAIGDAVGIAVKSACYYLDIDIDAVNETIRMHGTPSWTASGSYSFRVIATEAGYWGTAPVDHDYTGYYAFTEIVSKSSNITSDPYLYISSSATINIGSLIVSDTNAIDITLRLSLNPISTPTAWTPYSNICPISGHTDADVTRTGVNVWDEEWENGIYSVTTGEPLPSATRIRSKNAILVRPNTTYYFNAPSYYGNINVHFYDRTGSYITSTSSAINRTFTTPSNCYFIKWNNSSNDVTTYGNDISINYPSTDKTYHAYAGTTYPIPLGQTVYGGTLDVLTGLLTVTMVMLLVNTNNGELRRNGGSSSTRRAYYIPTPVKENGISGFLSNQFTFIAGDVVGKMAGRPASGGVEFYLPPDVPDTDAGVQQWFADNPTELCYPLATPLTIQLTPTQVELLQGENNLFSDGEMTLVYLADGNASDVEALNILLGNRYYNNHEDDEPTDREALNIILGGNER